MATIFTAAADGTLLSPGDLDTYRQSTSDSFDINALDAKGRTALSYGAFKGHVGVVKLLANEGADVNKLSKGDRTALWYATAGKMHRKNRLDIVAHLVERGAAVDTQASDGYTPLMKVIEDQHDPDIISYLVDHGASTTIRKHQPDGPTPEDLAEATGDARIIRALKPVAQRTATRAEYINKILSYISFVVAMVNNFITDVIPSHFKKLFGIDGKDAVDAHKTDSAEIRDTDSAEIQEDDLVDTREIPTEIHDANLVETHEADSTEVQEVDVTETREPDSVEIQEINLAEIQKVDLADALEDSTEVQEADVAETREPDSVEVQETDLTENKNSDLTDALESSTEVRETDVAETREADSVGVQETDLTEIDEAHSAEIQAELTETHESATETHDTNPVEIPVTNSTDIQEPDLNDTRESSTESPEAIVTETHEPVQKTDPVEIDETSSVEIQAGLTETRETDSAEIQEAHLAEIHDTNPVETHETESPVVHGTDLNEMQDTESTKSHESDWVKIPKTDSTETHDTDSTYIQETDSAETHETDLIDTHETELTETHDEVETPEPQTAVDFKDEIDAHLTQAGLSKLFADNDSFLQQVADNAAKLKADPSNPLRVDDDIRNLTTIALYQPVIYCDDSTSMWDGTRIQDQINLVKHISRISTRLVPNGYGSSLQFLNSVHDLDSSLSSDKVAEAINTKKILDPLVYDVLNKSDGKLHRPLLISCLTDGNPTGEAPETFQRAILECVEFLEQKGYQKTAVRFQIGQIGNDEDAEAFLKELRDDSRLKDVLSCSTQRLDEEYKKVQENDEDLEHWLLETLLGPIANPDTN
ncbi:Ankyrin-2 [Cladobotryum mycophilum]|uniref:Ankyrin-2 n=1 Tax=Cladobotryum mycophilum TaxID=491253 RepID=A0ABR0SPH6_9HYPO